MTSDIRLRAWQPGDEELEQYDHSALNAVATCPRYGVLRYGKSLTFSSTARAMPLEAGKAMHQVFAAIRCAELIHTSENGDRDRAMAWARQLFGPDRWADMVQAYRNGLQRDQDGALGALVMETLESSGYYDDPRDKRRTIQNLQDCAVAFVQRYPYGQHPVWTNADMSRVGIEVGFQFVVESDVTPPFRYVGRIDGIHRRDGRLVIHDGKTAARLDDAWSSSFSTSHQMTGYCVAATMFTGEPVWHGIVDGLAIPLPKAIDFGGVEFVPFSRTATMIGQWATWATRMVAKMRRHIDDPLNATMYTHSCSRYFRSCVFLPLCACPTREEAHEAMRELIVDHWDPLDEGHDAYQSV